MTEELGRCLAEVSELCSCSEDAGVSSFEEAEKTENPAHGLGETEKARDGE